MPLSADTVGGQGRNPERNDARPNIQLQPSNGQIYAQSSRTSYDGIRIPLDNTTPVD